MQKDPIHNFLRSLMLPLSVVDRQTPEGVIVELGCGEGVIAAHIAKNKKRTVVGVDLNKERLGESTNNLKFVHGDIKTYLIKDTDGVIISDVLHHLNYPDQQKVLKNVARGLKKDGVLIIKEIDTGEFVRSTLSRFWDFLFYPKDKICYNNSNKLKTFLQNLGFKVEIKRTSRFFPGSTTLFLCQKS